jgi:hypothetical protein
MNTKNSSTLSEQSATPPESRKASLLGIGAQVVHTTVSMLLAVFAAVFLMWINSSQHELDQLQDKPK